MKLYTEEQVRELVRNTYCGNFYDNDTPDDLVNELTPIELPSDEEIITASLPTLVGSSYSSEYIKGFNDGTKWVIEQIKQQADGK